MSRNRKSKKSECTFDDEMNSIAAKEGLLRSAQDGLYRLNNAYVGSKRAILPHIADAFEKNNVKFNTMLDLFSGSGVVSIFFKMLGKRVASNDLLTSSYYNSLVFSENESVTLNSDQIEWLCTNNSPDKQSWVRDHYSERFTNSEALFLDNYRANVDTLTQNLLIDKVNGEKQSLLKNLSETELELWKQEKTHQVAIIKALAIVLIEHYVMDRCFIGGRLNHGQIIASLEHRISHPRNCGHAMKFKLEPLPTFFDGAKGCKAYNNDAILAVKEARVDFPELELAYLDPPYGQSQSDYSNIYQFCEEYIYKQLVDEMPHIKLASEKFAKKKNYQEHFREVLESIKFIPTWAVSFNASSFDDSDGILKILKDYKSQVIVVNIDHEYRYRKTRGSAVEYLFIAR